MVDDLLLDTIVPPTDGTIQGPRSREPRPPSASDQHATMELLDDVVGDTPSKSAFASVRPRLPITMVSALRS